MKGRGLHVHALRGLRLLLMFQACLCAAPEAVSYAGDECEIVKKVFYESRQPSIVTDWNVGVPYRRYQVVTYPCATLTIRDNSRLVSAKEVEATATFIDQSTITKGAWCDKKLGEEGYSYSCVVCFESESPISQIVCAFR